MRKYAHFFVLRRLMYLSRFKNERLFHGLQPRHAPPPPPPPSASHNSHLSGKRWGGNGMSMISRYYLQPSLSNILLHHYNSQSATSETSEILSSDYQVTIKGRDVISAALGTAHEHWLPLSNLDLLLPPLEVGIFFCYKRKNDNTMSPDNVVKTIKRSLAEVLSTFYPLAGEITANSQGEPELVCNNRGVEVLHAHADVELKDLDFYHPDESIKGKLVPQLTRGVLSIQVTELVCGGIVISCTIDHRVADAYSLHMFLVAWAEVARLKPISNIPSFRPSILNPRHPPCYDATMDNLYIPISSLPPPPPSEDQLCSRLYHIPAKEITLLQSQASTIETKRSKLQSFTAFLWKTIAEGGSHDENETYKMGIIVNGRKFLNKKSSSLANHFGNVLSIPYSEATVADLKGMSLSKVADKIHRFLSRATKEEHFRSLIDWVELHRPEPTAAKIYCQQKETDGEAMVVSSGQGLLVEDMDLGWGKPEFGSYYFPWGGQTGYIVTMPSMNKNGDWVVYMHLYKKHLDLIESKAAHVFTPLTHSYLGF